MNIGSILNWFAATTKINVSIEVKMEGGMIDNGNVFKNTNQSFYQYTININSNRPESIQAESLFHELVHINQMESKRLIQKNKTLYWDGKKYDADDLTNDKYWHSPWEVDARINGFKLMRQYNVDQCKKW